MTSFNSYFKNTCVPAILLTLFFIFISNAEKSRESLILSKVNISHQNINYKSAGVQLNFNFWEQSHYTIQNITPSIIFNKVYGKSNNKTVYHDSLTTQIHYMNFRQDYKEYDTTDLLSNTALVRFYFKNRFNKYFFNQLPLHFGVNNSTSLIFKYSHIEDYKNGINTEGLSDYLKDLLVSDWENTKNSEINYGVVISPKIGIGRKNDQRSLLKALLIEKLLLKRLVIKFPLSEKSIHRITSIIDNYTDKNLRSKENLEKLRNEINIVVTKDAAADKEMLRYLSPLDLKKILLVRYNNISSGLSFNINFPGNFDAQFRNRETSYPHDIYNKYNDVDIKDTKFTYRQDLGLNLDLNKSFNRLFHLRANAQRTLLSTDFSPDFKDSENKIKWKNLLDIRWSSSITILPHSNLHIAIGLNNLRSYLCIPNNTPEDIYTSINIFIEDYLEIASTLNYRFKLKNDEYNYFYSINTYDMLNYRKLAFKLILCYNF